MRILKYSNENAHGRDLPPFHCWFVKFAHISAFVVPFIGLGFSIPVHASVSLGSTFTFSQNFDSTTASSSLFPVDGTATSVPGGGGFDGAKIAGSGTTAMSYLSAAGSTASTGALYSFGTAATGGDRALGTLASGTNIGAFGVQIVNNSGSVLTGFTLTFNQEQYHNANSSGAVDNTVAFSYGTTATGALTSTNYLVSGTLTANTAGDLVSTLTSTSNTANTTFVSTARTVMITNISVAAGESIFLRWADANETGSDAALAIDDFAFTGATAVPEPATILAATLMVGALTWSQRRRLSGLAGSMRTCLAA